MFLSAGGECCFSCLLSEISSLLLEVLSQSITQTLRHASVREPVNQSTMAINIPGLIAMVVFYLLVLGTGIWASFKSKREQKKSAATGVEMTLLGNRNINWVVGMFTLTGEESTAGKTGKETV